MHLKLTAVCVAVEKETGCGLEQLMGVVYSIGTGFGRDMEGFNLAKV